MNRHASRALWLAMVLAAGAVVAPGALRAQGGSGFLFDQPNLSLKFEGGYGWQVASSGAYDWIRQEHTIGQRDLDAPYLGGELGFGLNDHFEIAIAVGHQSGRVQSEYRRWVDTDNLPIRQTTRLRQIPAVASLKIYPLARGRSVGRLAWVPRGVVPFIGGGAGFVSYTFEQEGDFVDFETPTRDVYYDRVTSEGEAFLARAQAGFNVSLGKQFVLTLEGRYNWSDTPMQGGWVDFDNIDLDGLQAIGGLAIRF